MTRGVGAGFAPLLPRALPAAGIAGRVRRGLVRVGAGLATGFARVLMRPFAKSLVIGISVGHLATVLSSSLAAMFRTVAAAAFGTAAS